MKTRWSIPWLVLTAVGAAVGAIAAEAPLRPALEIEYVPFADRFRATGRGFQGVELPLSELTALVRRALDASPAGQSPPAALTCMGLRLNGRLQAETLLFDGEIEYDAVGEGWTATPIEAGDMAWTRQLPTSGTRVLLARLGNRTWLFAQAPSRGRLGVEGMLVSQSRGESLRFNLGRAPAPTRLQLALPEDWSVSTDHLYIRARDSRDWIVWQDRATDGRLLLTRETPLTGSSLRRFSHERRVTATGTDLKIVDALRLHGRMDAGQAIALPLPPGVRVNRASTEDPTDPAQFRIEAEQIWITPLKTLEDGLSLTLESRALLEQGKARLERWDLPGLQEEARLVLMNTGEEHSTLLLEGSETLIALPGVGRIHPFVCWGALPAMTLGLAKPGPIAPPRIDGRLEIRPNDADLTYEVTLADPARRDLLAGLPEGWSLKAAETLRGGQAVPSLLQERDADRWRVAWPWGATPESVRLTLHRTGPWGAPGSLERLPLPVLALDGPQPTAQELLVRWPDALEVGEEALRDAVVASPGETRLGTQGEPARLAFRVTGQNPAGTLAIQGRRSDTRATLLTLMSLEEDRVTVRVLARYQVRLAPEHTFRLLLPEGTGSAVTIQGEGIREKTLRSTAAGDEWTIVTQDGVLGEYPLTLEWKPAAGGSSGGEVRAPRVGALGVTAQEGFLVLEGSESLELQATARSLTEVDLDELPPMPWAHRQRLLAAYRYVEPTYDLTVRTAKIQTEPPLEGVVYAARLHSTLSASGFILTRANYQVAARGDRQFFELTLPGGAAVWSVLVDGRGEKPSHRQTASGETLLLVPLAAKVASPNPRERAGAQPGRQVTLLYQQQVTPPDRTTALELTAPLVPLPVLQTFWTLDLPVGFEYLAFEGTLERPGPVRRPLATYLRTAYWPSMILLPGASPWRVGLAIVVLGALALAIRITPRRRREKGEPILSAETRKQIVSGLGLSLVLLMIVAILAAIAVPNFLEAQTRSKTARVQADLRSLATGIESYFVDNNAYPAQKEVLWQGPVKYLSSEFTDPYASGGSGSYGREGFHYAFGDEAYRKAERAGLAPPAAGRVESFWIAYSVGPDNVDDGGEMLYDSTNGTTSRGDVVRIAQNAPPAVTVVTESMQAAPVVDRAQMLTQLGTYDSTNGTTSSGDIQRIPQSGSGASPVTRDQIRQIQTRQQARGARGGSAGPAIAFEPSPVVADDVPAAAEGSFVYSDALNLNAPAIDPDAANQLIHFNLTRASARFAREAGLLSLDIELPQTRLQRQFESIRPDARLRLRLMPETGYLRLRLIVWMVTLLAMGALWLRSPRRYRRWLVGFVAVELFLPLVWPSPWMVLLDAAFEGALLSLIVPLAVWLGRRLGLNAGRAACWLAVACAALAASGSAGAQSPAVGPAPVEVEDVQVSEPYRIVVPYDLEQGPPLQGDPRGWLSRRDFERAWRAAHPSPATVRQPAALLGEIRLSTTLDPAASVLRGRLEISAVNPGDAPTSLPLAMGGLVLEGAARGTPGAALDVLDQRLVLRLPAHWAGALTIDCSLPVEAQGSMGRWRLVWPEAGGGRWELKLPYPNVEPAGPPSGVIVERLPDGVLLAGPVLPGPMDVAWRSGTAPIPAGGVQAGAWRAELVHTYAWDSMAAAAWQLVLRLRAAPGQRLPETVRLIVPQGLKIEKAAGPALMAATIQADAVVLRLRPEAAATVTLQGFLEAGASTGGANRSRAWNLAAARVEGGGTGQSRLRLEIGAAFEILGLEPRGLDQRPSIPLRQDYAVQVFTATAPDWGVRVELRSQPVEFKADVRAVLAPADGFLQQAVAVQLTPRAGLLRQVALELSSATQVLRLEGPDVVDWVQGEGRVRVWLRDGVTAPTRLELMTRQPFVSPDATMAPVLPVVGGAGETIWRAAVAVPLDEELVESALTGVQSRAPEPDDERLAALMVQTADARRTGSPALRAYTLEGPAGLRFELRPLPREAQLTVFNRVTIGNGLRSLEAVVQARPSRGRIRRIRCVLLLGEPDPGAAARLQASGPVRQVRTEQLDERRLRVTTELNAPFAEPVEIGFQLDQPVNTETGAAPAASLILPEGAAGSRALMLLRRAFEGELTDAPAAGVRPLDPLGVNWPAAWGRPRPSDRAFELAADAGVSPRFEIVRHQREESLRAIADSVSQRTILLPDGQERNELEIALQNQSDQFLKIALPWPRDKVNLFEVLVAGQRVQAALDEQDDRAVLHVPLIRTGLLDPELLVRVAYTAQTGDAMGNGGRRTVRLPELLDGVPVAQSSLVLMLPGEYKYSRFKGTLTQVELVDLGLEEMVRQAQRIEKVSEAALYAGGKVKQQAVKKLAELKGKLDTSVSYNEKLLEAAGRRAASGPVGKDEAQQLRQQETVRRQNLDQARQFQQGFGRNQALINEEIRQWEQSQQADRAPQAGTPPAPQAGTPPAAETSPAAAEAAPAPAVAPLEFPRTGGVFAFRQLQGTGDVRFVYASRKVSSHRWDLLLALALTGVAAALVYGGHRLVATRQRRIGWLAAICLAALAARVLMDIALIGLVVAAFLWVGNRTARPVTDSHTPKSPAP